MNDLQKRALLKVARDTVSAAVKGTRLPKVEAACGELVESNDPDLASHCGCFVTLKNGEELRGCIGQFIADKPLVQMVVEMAKASATGDPRFFGDQITPEELEQLDIEISVLSPLKKTADPLSLRLGVDGIYIKRGGLSGCFLPQVATEAGWTKEEFLSHCCSHKAGLPADAWKDPKTDVFLFAAEVFGAPYANI